MKKFKIAVVGAGFCGMACAYDLSRNVEIEVSMIDPGEVGDNASGIAAGLLHPFAGKEARLVPLGREGMAETLRLAKASEEASGMPSATRTGMLRLAVTDEQKENFRLTANLHADVRWCEPEECQRLYPGLSREPGIFIESGHMINPKTYLQGLWEACQKQGTRWIKERLNTLAELPGYDAIIVAAGSAVAKIPELAHLSITPVKGQILEIEWPQHLPLLQLPINSNVYLVPGDEIKRTVFAGATFERNFSSEQVDQKYAENYLLPLAASIFPDLHDAKVLNCFAGLRASVPERKPIARREKDNVWVLTGMGSKGLLYHALHAKKVVNEVLQSFGLDSKIID